MIIYDLSKTAKIRKRKYYAALHHPNVTYVLLLGAAYGTRIAFLTSLLEVTLQDNVQQVSNWNDI